jgi:hypothetical protein
MKLFKYNQFLGLNSINENVAKAKSYLKEFYLTEKAARELGFITEDMDYEKKEGERRVFLMKDFTSEQQQQIKNKIKGRGEFEGKALRVSDEEIRKIEQSEEFKSVRELKAEIKDAEGKVTKTYQLDRDNAGWVSHFTYFYYAENSSLEALTSIYERLIQYKDLLDKLPKKFDNNFIDESIPNEDHTHTNAEDLSDELDKLVKYKQLSKIKERLLPHLKRDLEKASELQMKDMFEIAAGFDEFEPEEKRETIWKNFFGEMAEDRQPTLPNGSPNPNFGKVRYMSRLGLIKDLNDFIKSAKAHLAGSTSDGYSERIDKINKTNDRFGVKGAKVVFNENGIMVVRVYSYAANNFLNNYCSHCIVNRGENYWDSYVGDMNAQYYLYNFNLPSTNPRWTIGVSIKPERTYQSGACQDIRNNYIGGEFKTMLKQWEKEYEIETDIYNQILNPLTREELDKMQRQKLADREIVKKGITIQQIKQFVTEDGANINKDNGKALLNAIEEDDVEKIKYILDLGASPTLGTPMAKAKSLKVIQLLVEAGAPVVNQVFDSCFGDLDALEYLFKAGLDPNLEQQKPFRKAIKGTWRDSKNPGDPYFEQFKMILKYGGKTQDDRGRNTVLKWCAEYGRFEILDYMDKNGISNKFTAAEYKDSLTWITHGVKIPQDDWEKMKEYLSSKIAEKS